MLSCPRSQGCRQKRLQTGCFVVSTEVGILGQLGAFGQDRMEKVVYLKWSHAIMSRSQGVSTKRLQTGCFMVSTEMGILGPLGIWGRMEKVVVPCCQGCQILKTPSCLFWGVDRAGYFGAAGFFGVGWRKFSIL